MQVVMLKEEVAMEWTMRARQKYVQKFLHCIHCHCNVPDADGASALHFDVEGTRDDTLIGLVMMNSVLHQVKDFTFNASPEEAHPPNSSNLETFVPEQFLETQRHTSWPSSSSTPESVDARRAKKTENQPD